MSGEADERPTSGTGALSVVSSPRVLSTDRRGSNMGNSAIAGAKRVGVLYRSECIPYIAILDDGEGVSTDERMLPAIQHSVWTASGCLGRIPGRENSRRRPQLGMAHRVATGVPAQDDRDVFGGDVGPRPGRPLVHSA